MKYTRYLYMLMSLFLCFCQTEKRENNDVAQDSVITINHENVYLPDKEGKANVYKKEYEAIMQLRSISKGFFTVKFSLLSKHINTLQIEAIPVKKHQEKPQQFVAQNLQKILFSESFASSLAQLERLMIGRIHLKGEVWIPKAFQSMKYLHIYNNSQLQKIHFKTYMNLLVLIIPKNKLGALSPSLAYLTKLQILKLFKNQLNNIDLSVIPWVQKVDISDNPISFDRIDSVRLKYPQINIVAYHYKKKRPGNYIDRDDDDPFYE